MTTTTSCDDRAFTVGDQRPDLAGHLTEGGVPIDLRAIGSMTVHVRRADRSVIVRAAARGADTGSWSMQWKAGDLSVPGRWEVEVQVVWSDGSPQTFGPASFRVGPQIA